ncbi:hypothetical protein MPER_07333 [Moniliophthora perniciosa FA553]|nr:hypothetical protein MPER_07333 [Moniliophthora perniciosa FA553]
MLSKIVTLACALILGMNNPAETAFSIFGTSHYGLSEEASNDWKRLTPAGGHLVRFSPGVNVTMSDVDTEVNFTVALFHQLKCLEIYRQEYIAEPAKPPSALSTKDLHAKSARQYDTVCRDWTLVYEAAEKNHQSWVVHPA